MRGSRLIKLLGIAFVLSNLHWGCESAIHRTFRFYEKNQEWQKAIAYLEHESKLNPRNTDILFWLGKSYLNAGQYEKAVLTLKKCIKQSAKYEKEINRLLQAEFRNQMHLANRKKREQKLAHLRNAVILQPQNPLANLMYGATLIQQEKPRDALLYLEAAASGLPSNIKAHVYLAQAYYKLKDYLSAERYLEKAFQLDPGDTHAHRLAGLVKLAQDETLAAIAHFESALATKWDPILAIKAYNLCIAQEQYSRAERILKRLLQNDPKSISYLEAMVDVLFRQQKYWEALPLIDRLLILQPEEPSYLEHRAMVYYWLGEEEKYQAALQKLRNPQMTIKQK